MQKKSNFEDNFKYRKHLSIVSIHWKCKNKDSFSFAEIKKEIEKGNLILDANKATQNSDIPKNIVKKDIEIFSNFICISFTSSIKTWKFSGNLKLEDIILLYKKGRRDIKENCRPEVLPNLSKIFEECIFK